MLLYSLAASLTVGVYGGSGIYKELLAETKASFGWLRSARRHLHRHPEIGLDLFQTADFVESELRLLNIVPSRGWARGPGMKDGAGLVFDLGTGKKPSILLRADMDALRIDELSNFTAKSKIQGVTHACGHDTHTAMLLGAAKVLKAREHELAGTVRFMFQPGEEGYLGGRLMVDEGVLRKAPPVDYALALHVNPRLPTGALQSQPGPVFVGGCNLEVNITGKGGHAGIPHLTMDPIIAGSALVQNLQSLVSRETIGDHPHEVGLISITQFQAGTSKNVIPDSAYLAGTLRSLRVRRFEQMKSRVREMVKHTALAHRCNSTVVFSSELPPLVIDPQIYKMLQPLQAEATTLEIPIQPGAFIYGMEDFAFVANEVPSIMYFIGTGSGVDPVSNYSLHSAHFAIDEDVLPLGSAFLAAAALQLLGPAPPNVEL